MTAFNAADGSYSYGDHAKHWGELKGFALGLQFNPWSPLHEVLEAYCYNMTTHVMTYGGTEDECGAGSLYTPESSAFVRFHDKVGDAPALPSDSNWGTYMYTLNTAKGILQDAYGFSDADVDTW